MNGCGNDFVVLDARKHAISLTPQKIRAIASRETGIGCDQILVIGSGRDGSDATMEVYNADGSQPDACGNGARCVALLLGIEQGDKKILLDAGDRKLSCRLIGANQVCVDMGKPEWRPDAIPLSVPLDDTAAINPDLFSPPMLEAADDVGSVNMGNPHGVFFFSKQEDLQKIDLETLGPALENHSIFPARANISFAHIEAREKIILRVWERGAGATLCCGTAACAAYAIAMRREMCAREACVHLPGGVLQLRQQEDDGDILMIGHAKLDFEGVFDPFEIR